jgi:hypothetical protein
MKSSVESDLNNEWMQIFYKTEYCNKLSTNANVETFETSKF